MATILSPPAFANADQCNSCQSKFSLFNRRHHCRNCGVSLCGSCCPFKDPLPHFGLTAPERTCAACHNMLEASGPGGAAPAASGSPAGDASAPVASAAGSFKPKPAAAKPFVGLGGASSSSRGFQSFSAMSSSIGTAGASGPASRYSTAAGADLEEQCREAIKNDDKDGVAYLLAAKADANYCDHTGNTLLHMACIMGRYPVVQMLCEAGGNPWVPNALTVPETAVDVAPPALQFRIKAAWPREKFDTKQ